MSPDETGPRQIRWRPASAADLPWLFELQKASMRPHIERVWGPWDEAKQRALFREHTDPTAQEVALLEGEAVGCRWIRAHADHIELVRIYLMPDVQGRGLGSGMVREVLARASKQGLPVRLRVLRGNPAQRLYERLGFDVTETTETHVHMQAAPTHEAQPA